jgi:hypothetical protein
MYEMILRVIKIGANAKETGVSRGFAPFLALK